MEPITQYKPADFLNPAEQQAIANINEALDFDADPGLWGDCGERDVPTALEAVERLSKEVCKLYAFKEYVHNRLDLAGIDKHEEQNALNGCRIGARLDDALAAPAPVVAPATGVVGEAGLMMSAETVRMLRADAAGLLSEEQWKELRVEGDVHDGAVQGRAYLATQLLAAALTVSAAPVVAAEAGPQWKLVLEGLPEDEAEALYVLGRWEDGDIRRCQVYKGELSCGFPARGGYPVWWMPEPIDPAPLQQDGHCVACQYPRYVLSGQHWGSCSNDECVNYKTDMASASYLQSAL